MNCLVDHPNFLQVVADCWKINGRGVKMFQVWTKLKALSGKLKALQGYYVNTQLKISIDKAQLDQV